MNSFRNALKQKVVQSNLWGEIRKKGETREISKGAESETDGGKAGNRRCMKGEKYSSKVLGGTLGGRHAPKHPSTFLQVITLMSSGG